MNWYYVDAGQQAGPVDDAQFEELARSGKIQADTLVWREGMDNWLPCSQAKAPGPQSAPPPSAPASAVPAPAQAVAAPTETAREAVCTECNRIFNLDDMIRHGDGYVCANCKPVFMQKLKEGAKLSGGGLNYAGFWIRFAAKIVDNLIIAVVVVLPLILLLVFVILRAAPQGLNSGTMVSPILGAARFEPAELIGNLIGLLGQLLISGFNALYSAFFLGKYGATPGKMLCKIMVVDADGNKIGYGRAFGRGCAEILSRVICSIGYIIAAFDGQKRTLHDHICSTRVVYK